MRTISVTCDHCGEKVRLERAKEVLVEKGRNDYHLLDLCADCLDKHLKAADSVNDTQGFRQKAAVLIRLPEGTSL